MSYFRLSFFVFAMAVQALGFEATLTVTPPLISLGESAQVVVEVRDAKRAPAPVLPEVDGLAFSGAGRSSQTRIVNGKVDSSISYTFTVYPQKTGEFSIGPFEYKVGGTAQTLQGQLKVVATSGETTSAQSWSDLVFAQMTADRDKVYVQEPFELTLAVYSRSGLQLAGNIDLQGMPETGLSELEWKELPPGRDLVDGQVFDVRKFRTTVRALGSGTFQFSPTVTVQVVMPRRQQQRRNGGFFDDAFGMFDRMQTRPVQLQTDKTELLVLPLPTEGKPSGFSGAVGRFTFSVTAKPTEVQPGDPITLTMTVTGEGNFDRLLPPALPEDESFRLYGDPVRRQGENGVRFEQVISPKNADVARIPAIPFSYFDTEAGAYRTLASRPIPIAVTASSNDTAQVFVSKETLIAAPPDQPFVTESDVQRFFSWVSRGWQHVRPWLWTIPASLGLGALLFLAQKFYHWRRNDIAWVRRQNAPKAARRALSKASHARKKCDASGFYNAMGKALADYFGNRLNLSPGESTADRILDLLKERGTDSALLETLSALFSTVERHRYGLGSDGKDDGEMKSAQDSLEKTLKQIEKTKL